MLLGSAATSFAPQLNAQAASASSQLPGAGVSFTAEQIQAARSLSSEQVADLKTKLKPVLAKLKAQIVASEHQGVAMPSLEAVNAAASVKTMSLINGPRPAAFAFTNSNGVVISPESVPRSQTQTKASSALFAPFAPIPMPPPCAYTGKTGCGPKTCIGSNCPPNPITFYPPDRDLDQDGLSDNLEAQLADNFTPVYYISGSDEQQFATFGDYVPMTVASLLGPDVPFSYYRVSPIGVGPDAFGNQRSFLRIDYLTLWNADGGLPGGSPACELSFVGLDQVIQELTGHELDVERSGMYVSAPPVNGGLNPDPNAYSIYYIYTAAHEGTFFDNPYYSTYEPGTIPAGNHVSLSLSLSKHSTYPSNPDYLNLIPTGYIAAWNAALTGFYLDGNISFEQYTLAQLIANDAFFGCVVERFHDQGGNFAQQRVNVGEPAHPINASTFIQDDSSRALNFTDKLTNSLPYYQ